MDLDASTVCRVLSKCSIPHEAPTRLCWLWTDRPDSYGYGRIRIDGRLYKAHHVLYQLVHGSIPTGLELDHTCCRRICVNPYHLEPVTHAENMRRMHQRQQQINALVKQYREAVRYRHA